MASYVLSSEGEINGNDLLVCTCMCGSAHDCGCVVDGSSSMAVLLSVTWEKTLFYLASW